MGESLKNFPAPGTTAGSDAALRREASGAAIEDTVSLSGHYLSLHGRPFTTFPQIPCPAQTGPCGSSRTLD
nr:MAG TPA: hypothetical protein [Caudoviricetes sp.]